MNAKPSFFAELQRRNVYKVGTAYAIGGWLVVQVVTQVLPIFHVAEWLERVLVIVVIAGFPVALALAWIYELTPDGLVRTDDVTPDESVAKQTGRHLNRTIIAVLSLAVLVLLAKEFWPHATPAGVASSAETVGSAAPDATTEKSIAVLPLANSTGDPANEYFSDGVSEELISVLSRLDHLKVIGRTSSFQFKHTTEGSHAIGDKLGVGYLLEGSVRKSAERVRIAVELVKAIDGASVWSSTYDRDLRDIFAVQSEIATAVAGQLKIALLGGKAGAAAAVSQAAPSNQNLAAYTAFLQGNFYLHRYSAEDGRRAVAYYEEAVRLDPGYAEAYARLAYTAALTADTFVSSNERKAAALAQARAAADTATRLAPDLAEAHAARGYLLNFDSFDLPGAFVEYQRAYELAPQDAANLNALSFYYATRAESALALDFGRRAMAVDPLLSVARGDLAFVLIATGGYDEAEAILRKTIELQPQSGKTHQYLSTIAILRGDAAGAVKEALQETDPFWRSYATALAEAFAGHHAEADAALRSLIDKSSDEGASQIAMVYGLRQQPDEMFQWLDHAREAHDPGVYTLYMVPFLARYRDDPRFAVLCRKLGLPVPANLAGSS